MCFSHPTRFFRSVLYACEKKPNSSSPVCPAVLFGGGCPEPVLMKKWAFLNREMVEAEGKRGRGGEAFPHRVWQRRPLRRADNDNCSHSHVSKTTIAEDTAAATKRIARSLSPYQVACVEKTRQDQTRQDQTRQDSHFEMPGWLAGMGGCIQCEILPTYRQAPRRRHPAQTPTGRQPQAHQAAAGRQAGRAGASEG
eukprot:COSAG06_NODE_3190_length_5707_cov_57.591655_2_plen_196_part_00